MADCGCGPTAVETQSQRRTLWIALSLNAIMFIVETVAGVLGHSTGLMADGLDMLADATAYAIALAAIGRDAKFKAGAATSSGLILLVLGLGILTEVTRRIFWGSEPEGTLMIVIAALAVIVNGYVLRLLSKQRRDEVHIKATWIFTRVDVIANLAVVVSGIGVLLTASRFFDLAVGGAIGVYVIKEALEILSQAKDARASA